MADKPGSESCNCGAGRPASAQTLTDGEVAAKVVKAQVPQDYQANFNLRIVPGRSLEGALRPQARCRPRGHATGWTPGTLGIDQALVATLAKADKAMVAWLAKDTANATAFLANPVAAMREAGVKLARAEEKALARANEAAGAARVVGPGVNVVSLTAKAFPNGRIGGLGASRPDAKPDGTPDGKPDGKVDNFGCGPKRKG